MTWTEWAQIAPGVTPIVTLVAASAACAFAWWQLDVNRRNQRETTAKTIFREYLKLTIEYADFAKGGIKRFKKSEREQYKWFVANFLWAAEEMLAFAKNDDVWKRNLQLHAKAHRDYLTSDDFTRSDLLVYSDDVRKFIEETFER